MKNRVGKLFLSILISFISMGVFGQTGLLRYADRQFNLENYAKAAEAYKDAYSKRPGYSTAVRLGETYGKLGMYEESYEWWGRAVEFEESDMEDYSAYLRSAMQAGYLERIDELLSAKGYMPFDFPELQIEAMRELLKARSQVRLVPVEGVNSEGSDFGTSLSADGNFYFSSDRGQVGDASSRPVIRLDAKSVNFSKERSNYNEREYYKIYRKDKEGDLNVVVTDLLGALHVNDPSIATDLNIVFYTAFVAKTKYRSKRDPIYNAGIYYGKLDGNGNITQSKAFPFNDHKSYGVMNPFVDTAEKRIYFASDMPGGFGGFDIYYVEYDSELNFSTPVNLGSEVNSSENESHPSRFGDRFYFSSKGHLGLGGMDVFEADHLNGKVMNVRNMGVPYNSSRDDFAFVVTSDGMRYLSSDREGGQGLDDIYTIEELFRMLLAKVTDSDGNLVADYRSEIKKADGTTIDAILNSEDYLVAALDSENDFVLRISKRGYFPIIDPNISTKGYPIDTIRREYVLAGIPYRTPLQVDIIYYDLNQSEIRDDAVQSLDRIGRLMSEYGFMDLIVSSHTDSRASDAYNEALSRRRGNAVLEYLARYGVDKERIKLQWFGEKNLVNDCGDGVPCPESKHQLNRRSELVLEVFPDTNKDYELPEAVEDPKELKKYLESVIKNQENR